MHIMCRNNWAAPTTHAVNTPKPYSSPHWVFVVNVYSLPRWYLAPYLSVHLCSLSYFINHVPLQTIPLTCFCCCFSPPLTVCYWVWGLWDMGCGNFEVCFYHQVHYMNVSHIRTIPRALCFRPITRTTCTSIHRHMRTHVLIFVRLPLPLWVLATGKQCADWDCGWICLLRGGST